MSRRGRITAVWRRRSRAGSLLDRSPRCRPGALHKPVEQGPRPTPSMRASWRGWARRSRNASPRMRPWRAGREILRRVPGHGQVAAAAILTSARRGCSGRSGLTACPRHPVRAALIRARLDWTKTDRQPRRPGPAHPRVRAMDGQVIHQRRAQTPARFALHACLRGHALQSRSQDQIRCVGRRLKTRQGCHRRAHAQAPGNRRRARQRRPPLRRKAH